MHDAVRELLLLGDTTIKAREMRRVVSHLKNRSGGKETGYQQQFDVSEHADIAITTVHVVHAVTRTVLRICMYIYIYIYIYIYGYLL